MFEHVTARWWLRSTYHGYIAEFSNVKIDGVDGFATCSAASKYAVAFDLVAVIKMNVIAYAAIWWLRASWIISSESHAASVYGSEGRIYGSYVHNRNAVAFRF